MDMPLRSLKAKYVSRLLAKGDKKTIQEIGESLKKKGDVWIIKYIDDFHTLDVLHTAKNAVGAKIVVDIDDNVWQIPLGNIAIGNPKQYANRGMMMTESVIAADYVTVSTTPLYLALKNLNDNVVVLPNLIDPKMWDFEREEHEKVRIGWVYSPTHIPDKVEIEEALETIYEKYGDAIEIVVFGTNEDIFKFPTTNVKAVKYDEYPRVFTEMGIDISVGPLADNDFNKCKSNIKWLESSMAGAAFIGSNVYPYEMSIKHGKTGFIAKTKNQWVKYISWLIDDDGRRNEMAKAAKEEVLKKYNLETNTDWKDFYEKISD